MQGIRLHYRSVIARLTLHTHTPPAFRVTASILQHSQEKCETSKSCTNPCIQLKLLTRFSAQVAQQLKINMDTTKQVFMELDTTIDW